MNIEQARLLTVGNRKLSDFTESEWNDTYKRNIRSLGAGSKSSSGYSYWTQWDTAFQLLKNAGEIKKEESVEPESKSTQETPKVSLNKKRFWHNFNPKSWRKPKSWIKKKSRPIIGSRFHTGDLKNIADIRGGYKKRRTMKRRNSLKRRKSMKRKSMKRNTLKRKTIKRRKNRN